MQNRSYFPIRVKYQDTGCEKVVQKPEDIACGRSFMVLETNVLLSDEPSAEKDFQAS